MTLQTRISNLERQEPPQDDDCELSDDERLRRLGCLLAWAQEGDAEAQEYAVKVCRLLEWPDDAWRQLDLREDM